MNSWRGGPTNFASRTSSESSERLCTLRLNRERGTIYCGRFSGRGSSRCWSSRLHDHAPGR
jgi:hypothetical protein